MNILDTILEYKAEQEMPAKRKAVPLSEMRRRASDAPEPRDFAGALSGADGCVALIAEVKRASPSAGDLVKGDFKPVEIAHTYARAGAHAISVLTDERFFKGRLDYLTAIRRAVALPVLRKDFIVDEYQLHEARWAGADAVLLIVAALDDAMLADFHQCAQSLGLAVLVEVHDEAEVGRALHAGARIVGVNNRDLRDFKVDLHTTARCAYATREAHSRGQVLALVSESGIASPEHVAQVAGMGAQAILVGESLITSQNMAADVTRFSRVPRPIS